MFLWDQIVAFTFPAQLVDCIISFRRFVPFAFKRVFLPQRRTYSFPTIFSNNVTGPRTPLWSDTARFNGRFWNNVIHGSLTWDHTCMYTGCNRRNGPDFGRVFLMLNYTDITQNTYIQSWTVTEILAREKSGLLWCLRTVLIGEVILPLLELNSYVIVRCSASDLDNGPPSKSV